MLNVGVTGSLGAGKSLVTGLFEKWGATVIDADRIVREIQSPGTPVTAAIVERFGADILSASGEIDRARLRSRILEDADERRALNAIVHPAVAKRRTVLLNEAVNRGDAIVVNEIPLLFEVMDPTSFDVIVVVDAPVSVRRERVMTQRGLSGTEVSALMNAQMEPAEKRRRAHHVIENGGSLADLESRSRATWQTLRSTAAHLDRTNDDRMLVVVAYPCDLAFAVGGTIARYADAGASVHILCASAKPDIDDAREAARQLGIGTLETVHSLDLPSPRAERGVDAVQAMIESVRPHVVITMDEASAHRRDDRETGTSVRAAWIAAGGHGDLLYVRPAQSTANADVRLDTRPWADIQRAAIAVFAGRDLPYRSPDPAQHRVGRELYESSTGPHRKRTTLFRDRARA